MSGFLGNIQKRKTSGLRYLYISSSGAYFFILCFQNFQKLLFFLSDFEFRASSSSSTKLLQDQSLGGQSRVPAQGTRPELRIKHRNSVCKVSSPAGLGIFIHCSCCCDEDDDDDELKSEPRTSQMQGMCSITGPCFQLLCLIF